MTFAMLGAVGRRIVNIGGGITAGSVRTCHLLRDGSGTRLQTSGSGSRGAIIGVVVVVSRIVSLTAWANEALATVPLAVCGRQPF